MRETMSEIEKQKPEEEESSTTWPDIEEELVLPDVLRSEGVKKLHMSIQSEWDYLQKSACQTAAGRALWKHVIHDPLAHLFAGETHLRNLHTKIQTDRLNNAREVSGVILAVRTLWFDTRIQAALESFHGDAAQVVLLGAGMDARSYRLNCLNKSDVFEVDFQDVLETKASLVQAAVNSRDELRMTAKSLVRVAIDIRDNDWFEQLKKSGFLPEINTVWVLEGILYYLSHTEAMQVLNLIAEKCGLTSTVLLADFMNKPSATLPNSVFHFYSDWPDQLLPTLGFSHVKLSQIGDPDANFGLLHDPRNLFNKLLRLPRTAQIHPDDGKPCCRLYLVEASGSPPQDNQASL
ncbi:putative methyltransferase Ppm1/Ppm2/Tcmp, S-adenosyl-L-methionine-dependent methyltransferase [Arabidopsis thaliana]|jgi:methyltransferase (TIGR00027 family)|nr:Leucine carboxyl methyltransferase [Arabidopsis thaliana]AED94857.1 Leucine carboxyl methyltransferase [Arabidopsis thaliana]|eukprot:NP_568611.2 Leucine carboxyl methyltransferase [Arabidopsis thaliana]